MPQIPTVVAEPAMPWLCLKPPTVHILLEIVGFYSSPPARLGDDVLCGPPIPTLQIGKVLFQIFFPLIRLVLYQLCCGELVVFACILAMALHSYRKYSFFAFSTLQRFLLLAYESHLVMHSTQNFSAICNLFLPFKTFIALSGLDQIR